jgi:hypothetical protein
VKGILYDCWAVLGSVYLKAVYLSACFVVWGTECEYCAYMHVGSKYLY